MVTQPDAEPAADISPYATEDSAEQHRAMLKVEGLRLEIAALRVRLSKEIQRDDKPASLRDVTAAFNAVVRAVERQHRMSPQDAAAFAEHVLREIEWQAADLGVRPAQEEDDV